MIPAAANVGGIVIVHDPDYSHICKVAISHVHSILEAEVVILNGVGVFLPIRNACNLNNGSGPGFALVD